MDRRHFIQTTKSAFLLIPFIGYFKFDNISALNNEPASQESHNNFPDKKNHLVEAICIFATPSTGDGKNGDDSFVDVIVDIQCYDSLYSAKGSFINNTEIESNVVRDMGINFSEKDAHKIFYDGIQNIHITILGNKPNQNDATNDKWNLRWEFYMKFKNNNILSTGGSEPQIEYNFVVPQTQINIKKEFFTRSQFLKVRGMTPGMHVG
ncbi:hypothetical protein [Flavobacterium humidisoli]|uniref:Uncharacterized protein n=1 Tax=Flavobacterium humidisoli TaxID=2937442 RepID=A0ABY4LXM1_9FLAO|nr:hypothetical protein [Flavobacterium humidisoli]UPZ17814.1 hypothetical protein M0M44_10795 [Flavobacterium humidisoli]